MTTVWLKVRVTGPLAPYGGRFAEWLLNQGYTDLSTAEQLRLMGHLSRWMVGEALGVASLGPEAVEAYCRARRAQRYTARLVPTSLGKLVEFLGREGVTPARSSAEVADADQLLLCRYRQFLVEQQGLVEGVVSAYLRSASLFLAAYPGLATGASAVGTAEVSTFCVRELPKRGPGAAANLAAGLRSFLRFLHLKGLARSPLSQAVPPVATRTGTGLPRGLAPRAVASLLGSCDRRTGIGRRDFAILLLLARLGLRAGEVAGLVLDDFDWHAGEVVIHGKGGRDDRLPLPDDVGTAIVGYLQRGRPKTPGRAVFIRAIAPTVALSPPGITWVVYSACDRAGVPKVGAHRLRHTLACDVLRSGGSLAEVGELLRHDLVGTTAIYAKVDFGALAPLAQPWPGGAA